MFKIVGLLSALLTTTANAEPLQEESSPEDNTAAEQTNGATDDNEMDFTDAERVGSLSRAQLDWLKPSPHQLPQNPYQHIDFTAYTLEWGEVQVGLGAIHAGILPRVQVGTSPVLNVIGVQNGNIKVNALHTKPVDISANATHYRYPIGDFTGAYSGFGGTVSVRPTPAWSVHIGSQYVLLGADGLPNTESISPWVEAMTGADLNSWRQDAVDKGINLSLDARAVTARVSTDIRFNRRDSLIIQAQSMVWGSIQSTTVNADEIPEFLGLGSILNAEKSGAIPLADASTASVSWQWSWKRSYLRMGIGTASIPGAWLMQSTEFAMRMGGSTRNQERRMRQAWRQNRRLQLRGGDSRVVADAV